MYTLESRHRVTPTLAVVPPEFDGSNWHKRIIKRQRILALIPSSQVTNIHSRRLVYSTETNSTTFLHTAILTIICRPNKNLLEPSKSRLLYQRMVPKQLHQQNNRHDQSLNFPCSHHQFQHCPPCMKTRASPNMELMTLQCNNDDKPTSLRRSKHINPLHLK
jgi:hypothetical protein